MDGAWRKGKFMKRWLAATALGVLKVLLNTWFLLYGNTQHGKVVVGWRGCWGTFFLVCLFGEP